MVFSRLNKLSNFLFDRFLMDEVASLLQKEDLRYDKSNKNLRNSLETAINYLKVAKEGYNFFTKEIIPKENIRKSLNAFNSIMDALENKENKKEISEKEFFSSLELIENTLNKILENKELEKSELNNLIEFFKLVGNSLSRRIDTITQKESKLFKIMT